MRSPEKAVDNIAAKSSGKIGSFDGQWVNELQSTMTLRVNGTTVTGTYTTTKSRGGGPLPPHPLVGSVNGNLIAFIVNWTDKAAITSWVGQLSEPDTIFALWQMTLQVDDPSQDLWESIWAGSDTFNRLT